MKGRAFLLGVFLCSAWIAFGEPTSPFSVSVLPRIGFPIGDSASLYSFSGGVDLEGKYTPGGLPFLSILGGLGYTAAPSLSGTLLSLFGAEAGAGIQTEVLPRLTLNAGLTGGYYVGLYGSRTGTGPSISGTAGVTFRIVDSLDLGISALYRNFLATPQPLLQIAGGSVVLNYRPGGAAREEPRIDVPGIEILPIFPVFYSYYDSHPVGKARIRNADNETIENLHVSFFITKYMDLPKESVVIPRLQKGEEATVDLFALLSDRVLDVTEGTKVASEIKIEYSMGGKRYSKSRAETVLLYDRNASVWDDNRKAAAFVSAKDPVVLAFAKAVAGTTRSVENRVFTENFRIGLAMFESLDDYGLEYVVDPKSAYADFSKDALAVDYLQFPRQTLEYRGGDCDDLSILYAALLESVGIETAFITIPGHIYMAFTAGLEQQDVSKVFSRQEDLILRDGKCWVPVEITLVKDGFIKAWRVGALEWRSNVGKEGVGFYPVHGAWTAFAPVGLSGASDKVAYPAEEKVKSTYTASLGRFIENEIGPQEGQLKNDILKNPSDAKYVNRLGILYARYDMIDKALTQFEKLTKKKPYVPALVNAGNIYYLRGDMKKALDMYERATVMQPDNVAALVGAAQANYQLENKGTVKELFAKLQQQDPGVASRYSYLVSRNDDTGRAAQGSKENVEWTE